MEQDLVARDGARLPIVELDEMAHIDIGEAFVELVEMGVEDAADIETARADAIGIDEKHPHRVAERQAEEISEGAGEEYVVGLGAIGEGEGVALDEA